ncbi:aldehyde dehydrogenase family protein [Bradyrhizobium erythrophlei]|uniref:Aldehyde dehydrogenase (NAD+)/betaine-aldehyde dehydrogenase/phenylacetaldehyde dehydrogenase n=1 Tax=Bradyrhizobium erythrophlei TaxID=1437360 RepID=A0A1M7U5X2_9BRAD|nr:aldehyde dehydrogenase family protein [Bradyrhizobium erythrophlei]SHN78324.1 aldehyde dehydrogenase (NAD+)/betaine-aldehyde dehydrogenase/phenylacetaldehyde dehydrogenase [Bradyrhizobium erythrophlei]
MDAAKTPEFETRIKTDLFINGTWVEGTGAAPFGVINPFDNSEICKIRPASEAQVNEAIEAAHAAFRRPDWKKLTGRERGTLLYRLAQLLRRDLESFAVLESLDTGIPIRETRMEVATSAAHLEYFAGLAGSIEGTCQDLGSRFNFTRREPFGVVGQIVPWNTPLKLMARGFAAAVACGNTMVVKPSIVAPLTNLRFGELVDEAGFPRGTINIITGSGRTVGKLIVEHPKVRKIIFTGGTEGGREILHQAAHTVTPAVLELGGKGPIIVSENIDWEETLDGVLTQAFARKAEVCFAGTRLFIPAKLHDKFVTDLAAMAERIPIGNPLDAKTQLGPLMTAQRLTDILAQLDAAKPIGAKVFCGGKKETQRDLSKGNFMRPTIVTDVKPDMAIARDELFGPVLCVTSYVDLDDAVRMANDSEYGLASYVWSNDLRESNRIAQELEAGNVFLNAYGYQSEIPFGGYKMSGIGREHGTEAMHEYTQIKSVTVGMERFKSRFEI